MLQKNSAKAANIKKVNYKYLFVIFMLVAVIGLFYVKWNPYYIKAFTAASKHSIGASIISGSEASAPAPSWAAALGYAVTYFKSVWEAVVLGLLLGSLVQVSIPGSWIRKAFGGTGFGSTAAAGITALPGMMCSCCAAPVAVGLRKSSASVNSSLAFFLANPVLNPATIIFMGFVLSWKFAFFRIAVGIIMVFSISMLANRFVKDEEQRNVNSMPLDENSAEDKGSFLVRWMHALWQLIIDTIPAYLIVVLLLGAVRAWLFPVIGEGMSNSILTVILFAVSGTLFVIPTAAEIPVVQTLMSFGLGLGPAAALIITLPAVNLPSLLIIKRAFPTRILIFVTVSVALFGIASGVIAKIVL